MLNVFVMSIIMCNFAVEMKKISLTYIAAATMLMCSCANEFNAVYKSGDMPYRYEYAKELYAKGKFEKASILFNDMMTIMKGRENGEECLYLYGMSCMNMKDYETAAEIFKKYYTSYPKGIYTEEAYFNIGQCMYNTVPEVRLDQSPTLSAMKAFQNFMDVFPYSSRKSEAEAKLYELQDKLIYKEYLNAKLYYNLGPYFGNCMGGGNNYEACIVTSQNALKDYPFTSLREDFSVLIMKSKYEIALHSVLAKQADRFLEVEDECYGFLNEFPESKEAATAQKIIEKCKKYRAGKLTTK